MRQNTQPQFDNDVRHTKDSYFDLWDTCESFYTTRLATTARGVRTLSVHSADYCTTAINARQSIRKQYSIGHIN